MNPESHIRATGPDTITRLAEHIEEIDVLLDGYGFHLHKLQPFHNGRITIKELTRHAGAAPVPAAVSWFYVRSIPKWNCDPLKVANLARRNKRSGGFYNNAKTVSAILGRVQVLLEQRALTMKRYHDFQDAVRKALETRAAVLQEMRNEIDWYDREHATLVDHPTDPAEWTPDDEIPAA